MLTVRRGCVIWLICLIVAPALSLAQQQAAEVRVMSYNIRYGTAQDGDNHWDKRKEFLLETIKAFDPDLLGTQETLGFQRDYLAEKLPGYAVLGGGRDDGKEQGEMAALYFKRSRFEKLDGGHFWLSETPDQPGSKSWDSALTRMATWVKLRDVYRIAQPTRAANEGTFSAFKAEATSGPRIDWIGVSAEWEVVKAAIDRTARAGRTPSDHLAVTAVVRWR